jgi:hypothetical protein
MIAYVLKLNYLCLDYKLIQCEISYLKLMCQISYFDTTQNLSHDI